MIIHTSDRSLFVTLARRYEELVPHAPFDRNDHLADMPLTDVVDAFWPASRGWVLVAVEPGFYSVLYVLEHAEHGVAAALIGANDPGELGSPDTWDASSVATRARGIFAAHMVHGVNRLNILDEFVSADRDKNISSLDESMLGRLLHSPAFMDEETTVMVALTTDLAPLVARANRRHNDHARRAQHLAAPSNA